MASLVRNLSRECTAEPAPAPLTEPTSRGNGAGYGGDREDRSFLELLMAKIDLDWSAEP